MEKSNELEQLRFKIDLDETLPLKKTAKQLVFGVGNPDAQILFIGEAPGYWEDIKGEPFVGNAGKLLDKALAAIKLTRQDVFITNVVMYRPPENRDPFPEELKAFDPYITQLIQIIKPKIIVTLGRFSMAKFLPGVKITQVHGKEYDITWHGMRLLVVPMFHPAAALRAGEVMQLFKKDFLNLPHIVSKHVTA